MKENEKGKPVTKTKHRESSETQFKNIVEFIARHYNLSVSIDNKCLMNKKQEHSKRNTPRFQVSIQTNQGLL